MPAAPSFMTDTKRTPKLLVDALDAIVSAQEFTVGCSLDVYIADKMRRSPVAGSARLRWPDAASAALISH